MSINIKNREAEALLAELKVRTGKGTTDLLLDLLRREKEKLEAETEIRVQEARESNRRIRERWLSRPLVDPRPLDQMIEWDENGLPK